MPWRYVREMAADWFGASRAYEGHWPKADDWPWLEKNRDKILPNLHTVTRARLVSVLGGLGFRQILARAPSPTPNI